MRPAFLSLFLAGAAAVAAPAPDLPAAKPPAGPPPRLVVVSAGDKEKGELYYQETAAVPVAVTRVQREQRDGRVFEVPVTETVLQQVTRVVVLPLKGATAHGADGKAVPLDEVFKRVAPNTVFLVAADGKPLDPAYLKLLAPDALVIVPPAAAAPAVPPGQK